MKINQVEQLVGITKKNIRFYEEQGLLSPGRNADNGYREYSERDIRKLEQIKFLRKLGIPIDEIKLMQSGKATVADTMKRHIVTLNREQQNLNQSMKFCEELKDKEVILEDLDIQSLLQQMDSMEKAGTSFRNIQSSDIKPAKYAGAVIASTIWLIIMGFTIALMLWAVKTAPEEAPPLPILIFT